MTLEVNKNLETPSVWTKAAPSGALTEDLLFTPGNQLAYRRIIVGVLAGPLILYKHNGDALTFSLAQLQALSGVLDGQWSGIKATGTTSYDFMCGQ